MDPLSAGLAVALAAIKAREQWWSSLTPETQTQLAERYAQGEIRVFDFLDKVWSWFKQQQTMEAHAMAKRKAFGGKKAAPFVKGGKRKKSSARTAKGTKRRK